MNQLRCYILTISDRCCRGEREDRSGERLVSLCRAAGWEVVGKDILPDEKDVIVEKLSSLVSEARLDLILTTGGTGLGPRDVTPEATSEVVDREVPGISELLRWEGMKRTPYSALSRGRAGLKGQTLIINLPGSPRAVEESFEALNLLIPHAVEMMRGAGHEG